MTSPQCGKSSWLSKLGILGVTALLGQAVAAQASTSSPSCPELIQEKSIRLADTPAGWDGFVASPLYLHGAAPMSGPPEKLGELSDYTQKRGRGEWVFTYKLDGEFPDGKWLVCMYGESDQIKLSRRLEAEIQACTFTYRKGKYVGQHDIAIVCKK